MSNQKPKYIISGGGTGGHIFPAIAIANALKELQPEAEFLFVGALGRMEMERVPAAGYKIVGLPIMGFPRKPTLQWIKVIRGLIQSSRMARKIVRDFKPNAAIGVGGYASGPLLKAAASMGVPTLIQEQNSYAGITNKLLSKRANKICVAYEQMDRFFPKEKICITGNPIRKTLIDDVPSKVDAIKHFNLDPEKKLILIIGGSLGARTVNESVIANVEQIQNSGYQVLWQTGKLYFDNIQEQLKDVQTDQIHQTMFIDRMDLAYAAADVVISRAGASSISELCLVQKPCVLVPSPNVAEDHQTKNAMSLVRKNAAILVKDSEAKEELFQTTFKLLNDESTMDAMSKNLGDMAKPNAAEEIAKMIISLKK